MRTRAEWHWLCCRLERNNYYRLKRALQILVQTGGKPLSDQALVTDSPLDYDFRCFFLHRPRLEIFDRIMLRWVPAGPVLDSQQNLL